MDRESINRILENQKEYYRSGKTLSLWDRLDSLKKLYEAIEKYSDELRKALLLDLGKPEAESDMCEIRLTLSEITYIRKHLNKWMKEKRVHTPLSQFASRSFTRPLPYGNTLIMSPWNYPVLLTLEPLADALAAGNTAILKPSAYSINTTKVLKRMIDETFEEGLVALIEGGREENQSLLELNFDYIFFTGSKTVGKLVMEKAAKHLTPVTLELGGKSPCIVTKFADIPLSARRIAFGKLINCGQTCVAPDYILVDRKIQKEFESALIKEIKRMVTDNPLTNPEWGKIINEKHFERIIKLIDRDKTIHGGKYDSTTLKIEPTVLSSVTPSDLVMQEEIFGPLFPVIPYTNIEECIEYINSNDHPLALYIFTEKKKEAKYVMTHTLFGGGCVNDTLIHLATSEMPFGGVRESGIGGYHGKSGFDTFSHYTSIVDKKTWMDLPMRYRPYTEKNRRLINFFLK